MADPLLIIDPGHGGKDKGGGTNEYWAEKDMNLQISLYQQQRFSELAVPVSMTRTTDVYLGPEVRARLVQESGAKYCISNHINAGGGDGAEVIYSIHSDHRLAETLATAIHDAGQNVRRIFDRTYPGDENKDYYYMHRETGPVITVIVEYGFADSKKDDVKQLRDQWRVLAEAVVKGFCEYIEHPYDRPEHEQTPSDTVGIRGSYDINGGASREAVLLNGSLHVPIRQIIEDLNGQVIGYNNQTKHASIRLPDQ